MKRATTFVFFELTFLSVQAAQAQTSRLKLEDYLQQVKTQNQGIQGSQFLSQGAVLRSQEGQLLLAPTLFGSAQYSRDMRETLSPAFQGTRTDMSTYSLGISQLTPIGLQAKFSYNLISTSVNGATPTLVTTPQFYDARPSLELIQSLWRNGFGRETRATQELLEAQALATHYSEGFRATAALADAEIAYWRLAFAREIVQVQRESLERFKKMRDWNAQRAKLHLTDSADLLQAEAGLVARQLELQSAFDEESTASRTFNTIRGASKEQVTEALEPIEETGMDQLQPPTRVELRQDVRAAQQQERAALAQSAIGLEHYSPTLEVFANLSLNGRDASLGSAMQESFGTQHPWAMVGLRFSAPLNQDTLSSTRLGYQRDLQGAELILQRKLYEQEHEWEDILQKFTEAKKRLKLSHLAEAAQWKKLQYERNRHRRGRTTTFQVLLFEQDFANAQLAHLRAQFEILRLIAQMRTYEGTS